MQRLRWLNGVSLKNMQNYNFVSIHFIRWCMLHTLIMDTGKEYRHTFTLLLHVRACNAHMRLFACIKNYTSSVLNPSLLVTWCRPAIQ